MARKNQSRPRGGDLATCSGNETDAQISVTDPQNQAPQRSTLPDEIDRILGRRPPGQLRELLDPLAPRPLALGITRAIVAELGLDRQQARELGRRIGQWTGRPSYLEALIRPGAQRFGIDGQPTERVSHEHRAAAHEQLERFRQKYRARQAALRVVCRINAALPRLRLGRAGQ